MYVETNFVLELAFMQEQHQSCDDILTLSEARAIELVMPSFSIAEPYETLIRRSRRRNDLSERLDQELRELSRSENYAGIADRGREIRSLLTRSNYEDQRRLDEVLTRVIDNAYTIPVGADILRSAIEFQSSLGLEPQDSIIYASVLSHLMHTSPEPKCFLNRNSRDFYTPDIMEQLTQHQCRLITRFDDGLNFIRQEIC